MIGSVSTTFISQVVGQLGQLAIIDKLASMTSATNSNDPTQSTDVNMVQTSKYSRCKSQNQRRKKSSSEQEEANSKETQPGNNKKGKKKLKFPCLACKEDHFTKDYLHLIDVHKFMEQSKNPTPVVLTNPFPTQHQQMVAQVPTQQPATQSATALSKAGSSSVHIIMVDVIDLTTRAKNYEKQLEGEASTYVDSPSLPQSNGPLTFEKTTFEAPSHPSKGTLRHTHNLNTQAAQHYSIIEDLAQALCTMSTLEVLQSCPSQRKALLHAIGAVNSADESLLYFDPENSEPHLPQSIVLQISIGCLGNQVHRTMLDEGATTCIMSYSCW